MIRSIVSHGYGQLEWVTVKPELQMEKNLFAAGCCREDMI